MKYSDIVDYDKLDPVKKAAIESFSDTIEKPSRIGLRIVSETLGEPAIAIDFPEQDFMLAFNVEGLGTKNIIADKMSLIFNDEGSQVSFWRNEFEVALFQTNKIYGFELLDESDYTRKTIKTFKLKGVI